MWTCWSGVSLEVRARSLRDRSTSYTVRLVCRTRFYRAAVARVDTVRLVCRTRFYRAAVARVDAVHLVCRTRFYRAAVARVDAVHLVCRTRFYRAAVERVDAKFYTREGSEYEWLRVLL